MATIPNSRQSESFFKKMVLGFASNATYLQSQGIGKVVGAPKLGKVYFHWYDPKLKDILPFYDRFPLSIPLKYYNDGYLGLNLHYLPPGTRNGLFQALQKLTNARGTKINVNYDALQAGVSFGGYEVCIKRYLMAHIRSPFLEIDPKYWEQMVNLPVTQFKKGKPY